MTSNEGYQERLKKYIEEERERKAREAKSDEVKHWRLRVRMPLGCWLWLGLLVAAGVALVRWILR